jgi:hypothetical protein
VTATCARDNTATWTAATVGGLVNPCQRPDQAVTSPIGTGDVLLSCRLTKRTMSATALTAIPSTKVISSCEDDIFSFTVIVFSLDCRAGAAWLGSPNRLAGLRSCFEIVVAPRHHNSQTVGRVRRSYCASSERRHLIEASPVTYAGRTPVRTAHD